MRWNFVETFSIDPWIHFRSFWHIILSQSFSMFFSITPTEMAPFTEQLLSNLFKALALPGSAENEYIMKGKPDFPPLSECSTLIF